MGEDEVVGLEAVDRGEVARVGGKGAHLGELMRLDGVRVPPGFCVTTAAFRRFMAGAPSVAATLARMGRLAPDDREGIAALSAEARAALEAAPIPDALGVAITRALAQRDADARYAVRSSATAEDLPGASFAGQHDSFLDVAGPAAILAHVRCCWASLHTERAVAYRLRHGVAHDQVLMAVVVQRMLDPEAAGVLFTADPLTGHRRVARIEATAGLADALVTGRVNTDVLTVRDDVVSRSYGGAPALADAHALALTRLGRRIEAHFGAPQDIEWCLVDGAFQVVQSRPITTLYPVPAAPDDEPHVYVSVGHQQMMTEAMRPLGISVWQLTAARPMFEAGGRLFVDIARQLAAPPSRAALLGMLGRSDPLIRDALEALVARGDMLPAAPAPAPAPAPPAPASPPAPPAPLAADPELVRALVAAGEASTAALERDIAGRAGVDLVDFVLADLQVLRRLVAEPRSMQVIMAAIEATWWLNDHLRDWLGDPHAADALAQSAPGNVTSEMGLALLQVADAIRPHADVVAFLRRVPEGDDGFLDALPDLPGGPAARAAIDAWLARYGMRCVGEIDITRPRWRERPTALLPLLLGHVERFAAGEAERRFAAGLRTAEAQRDAVLARLRALPDGDAKAAEAAAMIERVRTFIGYREYPKYLMIRRYDAYRRALLAEAERLVAAGVLRTRADLDDLTLPELREVAATGRADLALVDRRRAAFLAHRALTPPRVMTSDGEIIDGAYRRDDVPADALPGIAVSAGVVEGRARVVSDLAAARVEPGDILVTAYTDPSWTPLFVAIAGLVTEVGSLMTHGSVIAREYGLPAVVGVADATRRIRDGQRIRVDGGRGFVAIVA